MAAHSASSNYVVHAHDNEDSDELDDIDLNEFDLTEPDFGDNAGEYEQRQESRNTIATSKSNHKINNGVLNINNSNNININDIDNINNGNNIKSNSTLNDKRKSTIDDPSSLSRSAAVTRPVMPRDNLSGRLAPRTYNTPIHELYHHQPERPHKVPRWNYDNSQQYIPAHYSSARGIHVNPLFQPQLPYNSSIPLNPSQMVHTFYPPPHRPPIYCPPPLLPPLHTYLPTPPPYIYARPVPLMQSNLRPRPHPQQRNIPRPRIQQAPQVSVQYQQQQQPPLQEQQQQNFFTPKDELPLTSTVTIPSVVLSEPIPLHTTSSTESLNEKTPIPDIITPVEINRSQKEQSIHIICATSVKMQCDAVKPTITSVHTRIGTRQSSKATTNTNMTTTTTKQEMVEPRSFVGVAQTRVQSSTPTLNKDIVHSVSQHTNSNIKSRLSGIHRIDEHSNSQSTSNTTTKTTTIPQFTVSISNLSSNTTRQTIESLIKERNIQPPLIIQGIKLTAQSKTNTTKAVLSFTDSSHARMFKRMFHRVKLDGRELEVILDC